MAKTRAVKNAGAVGNIEAVRKIVSEFLKSTLNAKEVKVIKVMKVGNVWETLAEVYEESSFIKSLGLSTKVQDRNIYTVKLDENLEVQSYGLGE